MLRPALPVEFRWGDYGRYTFSLGIDDGDALTLSGMTAARFVASQRQSVCPSGLSDQAEEVLDKIDVILASKQLAIADIVEAVVYVVSDVADDHGQVVQALRRRLGDTSPTIRSVCVDRLLRPDALVEIAVVARRESMATTQMVAISPEDSRGQSFQSQVKDVLLGAERALADLDRDWSHVAFAIEQVQTLAGTIPSRTVLDHSEAIGHQRIAGARFGTDRLLRPGCLVQLDLRVASEPVIVTSDGSPQDGPATLAAAARTGDRVFLSGQSAGPSETSSGIRAESEAAYKQLLRALEAAGGSPQSLVETVEHVTHSGLDRYAETADVRRELLPIPFTAATGTVCSSVGMERSFLLYGTARIG